MRTFVFPVLVIGLLVSSQGAGCHHDRTETAQEETQMEQAKRKVNRVDPVVKKGIRYEEIRGARGRGFDQNGGVISATDEKSGEELWTLVVYETEYDEQEEADVQDVYIKKMKANWGGTKLIIVNERGREFEVDLETRSVTER